jgi:hypothetical protein
MRQALEIMSCYARKDQHLLRELKKHLAPLSREGLITLWDDMELKLGENWEDEIKKHLTTAHIILLLVSADSIASEYFYSKEMKQAMERHLRGEVRVIPIILRPVDWKTSPFAVLQALPPGGQPVTEYANQDSAFIAIVAEIRKLAKDLLEEESQKRVRLLEKKIRHACIENDKLAIVDAYDQLQHSPYAHSVSFAPQLQQQIDQAYQDVQELRSLLAKIRGALARKHIKEISKSGEDMYHSRHYSSSFIKSFLTEEEHERIQLAKYFQELLHSNGRPLDLIREYEQLQSSPHREAFDFTLQEQSQINQAHRYSMSLVQSKLYYFLNREKILKREYRLSKKRYRDIIEGQINEQLEYNRELRSVTIAIVGDVSSGQHTYFTALIHELERWMKDNEKKVRATCVTTETRRRWDNSLSDLFNNKGRLPAFIPASHFGMKRDPLVYEILFAKSRWLSSRKVNLVLYAGEGEDHQDPYAMLSECTFLFAAHAVIFMLDPWNIPHLAAALDEYAPGKRDSYANLFYGYNSKYAHGPSISLKNFNFLLDLVHKSQYSLNLKFPLIAITLSKSDSLQYLPSYEPYTFLTPSRNNKGVDVDLDDLQAIDGEVRQLLSDYKALPKVAKALQVRFFAVSATGHLPDSEDHYPAIEPNRCLDPFLWIFYSLGLLDRATGSGGGLGA